MSAKQVVDLAAWAQPPLNQVAQGLSELRQQPEELRENVRDAERAVRVWTVTGAVVLTIILIWFGLGQVCLIGWGRRQFTPRTDTP